MGREYYSNRNWLIDQIVCRYCFCKSEEEEDSLFKGMEDSRIMLNKRRYESLIRVYVRRFLSRFEKSLSKSSDYFEDVFQELRCFDTLAEMNKHMFALHKIV